MEEINNFENRTAEILAWFKEELSHIRSGRPTPKLLDGIRADYFGENLPLNQMATIGVIPPRELTVSPWDLKNIPAIAKAIEAANLGFSVTPESTLIRVFLPPLSEERAKEMARLVKNTAEEGRIRMRSARDKAVKRINELPEDQKYQAKDNLQKIVDAFNRDIDAGVEAKIAEIGE
jgi:ribosome recycling factor